MPDLGNSALVGRIRPATDEPPPPPCLSCCACSWRSFIPVSPFHGGRFASASDPTSCTSQSRTEPPAVWQRGTRRPLRLTFVPRHRVLKILGHPHQNATNAPLKPSPHQPPAAQDCVFSRFRTFARYSSFACVRVLRERSRVWERVIARARAHSQVHRSVSVSRSTRFCGRSETDTRNGKPEAGVFRTRIRYSVCDCVFCVPVELNRYTNKRSISARQHHHLPHPPCTTSPPTQTNKLRTRAFPLRPPPPPVTSRPSKAPLSVCVCVQLWRAE